jgi:hypothetical protein
MTAGIDDLSPFFEDRCWTFVLLAREANVGVILRRGPTKRFGLTLWNTEHDRFEGGQWFHGRIYPNRCDLSPDGKLFIYFAGKFRTRDIAATWIAVSRPPYLTALALWPVGDTWGGQCVFFDNRSLLVTGTDTHDPDHPPGPLRVLEGYYLDKADPRRHALPCWWSGWQIVPSGRLWRKASGDLNLETGGQYSPEIALFMRYRARTESQSRRLKRIGPTGIAGPVGCDGGWSHFGRNAHFRRQAYLAAIG